MTPDQLIKSGACPDGLPPLRDVIERYELRAKKSLGQNFLINDSILDNIVNYIDLE